ncbi:MAG TPA: hypothetical protein VKC53_00835 [Patescibacteria group bacterium]|nr:hypothetical protein [Patescibacteria group bacterium]
MSVSERHFRSLVIAPGQEIRQEGGSQTTPFGPASETLVSAIMKELHIHTKGDETTFSLDNPVVGGPVVICFDKEQRVLVPGDQITLDRKNITVVLKKVGHIQMLILD